MLPWSWIGVAAAQHLRSGKGIAYGFSGTRAYCSRPECHQAACAVRGGQVIDVPCLVNMWRGELDRDVEELDAGTGYTCRDGNEITMGIPV